MYVNSMIQVVYIPWDDAKPLQCLSFESEEEIPNAIAGVGNEDDALNVIATLLVRSHRLYAHHNPSTAATAASKGGSQHQVPNVRATRLAMACGLLSMRLRGEVILSRRLTTERNLLQLVNVDEIYAAACGSYDLRRSILKEVLGLGAGCSSPPPEWLENAARENYHDAAVLQRLASVMQSRQDDEKSDDEDVDSCSQSDEQASSRSDGDDFTPCQAANAQTGLRTFVANVPLCLECRRPTTDLCPVCEGAYFCSATCRTKGWSHDCLCPTWKIYTQRRAELSTFPMLGFWCDHLTSRPFQLSEHPYTEYLTLELRIPPLEGADSADAGWWRTEMGGWKGGQSQSAQSIQLAALQRRLSYAEGFYPVKDVPVERPVSAADLNEWEATRNCVGLLRLSSWYEYYQLRHISMTSPVALLLTYPLTLYYAIVEYGQVPFTVAMMLNRPLRIHVVGVEKEINFLDIFKEISFLLPDRFRVELIFVVRDDMLPSCLRSTPNLCGRDSKEIFSVDLTETLHVSIISGVYGSSTLDPSFDCGSGPPDLLMAFNAGLYAYESWRSVVTYLDQHSGVVGVMTDYNEFSGVQCASLDHRETLSVNPFRQPRAMPVYSMNLPQFSNGFLYVFNPQDLDD